MQEPIGELRRTLDQHFAGMATMSPLPLAAMLVFALLANLAFAYLEAEPDIVWRVFAIVIVLWLLCCAYFLSLRRRLRRGLPSGAE